MKRQINRNFSRSKFNRKKKRFTKITKSKTKINELLESIQPNKDALIAFVKHCFDETSEKSAILLDELNILQSNNRYVTLPIDKSESIELGNPMEIDENQTTNLVDDDNENDNEKEFDSDSVNRLVVEEERINSRLIALRQQNQWFQETLEEAQLLPRPRCHWDFVLAEMRWLAEDFNREKNWKRICAKKLANSVVKALREKKNKISKDAKQETFKMKKSCATIAKMIKDFWKQMEKIVLAKQQFRLNAKHQEAMTTHLGKVIETTEKYTEWLTEDLNANAFNEQVELVKDPDFIVKSDELEESDFEETIEVDERELAGTDINQELVELKNEGEMELSDLISSLPEEYLSTIVPSNLSKQSKGPCETGSLKIKDEIQSNVTPMELSVDCIGSEVIIDLKDSESLKHNTSDNSSFLDDKFDVLNNIKSEKDGNDDNKDNDDDDDSSSSDENESDDESSENDETLLEQENFERITTMEYGEELNNLQNEANIPIEEIIKRYEMQHEKSEDSPFESDSSSSCSESSSDRESSSSGPDSVSMRSQSSCGLNNLLTPAELSNIESNKFKFPGEIEALTEAALSTQPKGFTIESADIKVNVPHLIRHSLREYQCVGLDWLAAIYEKRLNGILADEMGLGKTIQTIALLSYLACEKAIWGPHLIIVPTSVILNWEIEFKKWCPGFKILTYYGSLKDRREKRKGWTKTNAFHVCITSYKLAIQDSLSFKRKKWKYLILDEAQNIKNFKSQRWQTLLTFNSQRRLLLTGTPLQNNLMELWSLMHFLMPNIFQSHKEFQEWFGSPLTGMIEGNSEYNEQLVRRLHKLLRPFILRRLKKDVEKQMPKKYEHVIMCKLSKRQRFLYDDFMSLSSTQDTLAGGQFLSVINILMQLRKVCNHPNLFETRPTISPFLIINEFSLNAPRQIFIRDHLSNHPSILPYGSCGLADMALNMPKFVSERIMKLTPHPNLIEEVDSIVVSDWVSENKTLHGHQAWKTNRPLITRNSLFSSIPDESYRQEENTNLACLKFGDRENQGLRICREQKPSPDNDSTLPEHILKGRLQIRHETLRNMALCNVLRCIISNDIGPDVVDFLRIKEPNKLIDSFNSIQLPVVTGKSLNQMFSDSEDIIKRFVFCVPPALSNGIRVNKSCLMRQKEIVFSDKLLTLIQPLIPDGHFQVLNLQRVQFPDTRLIQYDCGKLQTLEILLKRLHKENHRCLIFTQMTRMLDILEQFLSYLGYRYLRLDGTTKVEQRQLLMESFNQDSRIFVFILSTRSGGLGVNLTGADTVIFYDSDWNPTMDAQAQDRCHRIGQTRDVHIYRLISQMTVEENILKKANQKRTLNDMAIEGGQFNTAFFKTNTLQDLFKAPSGLEDLIQDQVSSENESNNPKTEIPENKDKTGFRITTRSGRRIKWRGPLINNQSPEKVLSRTTTVTENIFSFENSVDVAEFEEALQQIEEENDRIAASNAKAEVKADLAEFDETIPWEEIENSNDQLTSNSKADDFEKEEKFHLETERQIKEFEGQLNPIQRFGVRMVEAVVEDTLADQLEIAKQNLETSKKAWHLEQLKALHEADEMKAEIEEDDMLYCYGNYDPTSQKKELERLKKEEAEFFKAEKRKIEEKAKQAKADAARKAWSRQQHLLAIKRKHLQSNNRFNKISRSMKQNRSNMEHSQTSDDYNDSAQKNLGKSNDDVSSCRTFKSNHFQSHKINSTRQFYPKIRFNNTSQPYYMNSRSQVANRFPTFHLAPRPNLVNIQRQSHNINNYDKSSNQMQSISLSQNPGSFVQQSTSQTISLNNINNCSNKPLTTFSSRVLTNSANVISASNQCINLNSNNPIQIKSSNNITNGYSTNSQSFQIPIQSFCNFRPSLSTQQLIINSQPVLFINRQINPQNHHIIARPQTSTNISPQVMQIINRPSNINLSNQQTHFANTSLIAERPANTRFNNMISLPNSQSFILPSVSGTNTNIIRINCSTSNNYLSKPDFIAPNMMSLSNISNSMIRLATVTNSISNINGNYQTIASNPMIIINNNNITNPNKTLYSTIPNPIGNTVSNKPITVSQISNSNVMSTRANNLQN